MANTPWGAGLARLMRERNGLHKGQLARLCPTLQGEWEIDHEPDPKHPKAEKHMRAGAISSILNSHTMPETKTLQRIMEGLARWDALPQNRDQNLPPVEMWEFFVTDEQSHMLRRKEANQRELVDEDGAADRITQRILGTFEKVTREEVRAELRAVRNGPKK